MTEVKAWILTVPGGYQIAVSVYEMIEYVLHPQVYPLPACANYCHMAAVWRNRFIPMLQYQQLFGARHQQKVTKLGVLAYQASESVEYAAIEIVKPPYLTVVDDAQMCDLPEYIGGDIRELFSSCMTVGNIPTPILDTTMIFSDRFREKRFMVDMGAHACSH